MKKFKQKFIQITTWIAFGLAFLGYLMIRATIRHFDNYISYILLAAGIGFILFFAIMLFVLFRMSKKMAKKEAVNQQQDLHNLVNHGIQIPINLEKVVIKSNQWTENQFIETNHYDIEFSKNQLQTVLEFEAEIDGQKHIFHLPSESTPKTLEMYFAIQKETNVYVDPLNLSRFYLDLSFIRQS